MTNIFDIGVWGRPWTGRVDRSRTTRDTNTSCRPSPSNNLSVHRPLLNPISAEASFRSVAFVGKFRFCKAVSNPTVVARVRGAS